jgi:hypothetical protein
MLRSRDMGNFVRSSPRCGGQKVIEMSCLCGLTLREVQRRDQDGVVPLIANICQNIRVDVQQGDLSRSSAARTTYSLVERMKMLESSGNYVASRELEMFLLQRQVNWWPVGARTNFLGPCAAEHFLLSEPHHQVQQPSKFKIAAIPNHHCLTEEDIKGDSSRGLCPPRRRGVAPACRRRSPRG